MRAFKLEQFDYVLEDERELTEEEQTTFQLRPLTSAENRELQDQMAVKTGGGSGHGIRPGTGIHLAVLAGLRGWKNLQDDAGGQVEFVCDKGTRSPLGKALTGTPALETIDHILPAMQELANKIIDGNQLTKEDAKN